MHETGDLKEEGLRVVAPHCDLDLERTLRGLVVQVLLVDRALTLEFGGLPGVGVVELTALGGNGNSECILVELDVEGGK